MKTINEIKTDIDTLVRKQGNQGAIKIGDVLDDIVDIVQTGFKEVNNTLDKFKAQITNVATFKAAVPNTATEIVFAFLGDVDLTGYTKSGSIGDGIDVYANGTKYAVVSSKIICAPEISQEFFNDYSALATLDLTNFDTSNVTNMDSMFYGCAALTSLDLSNFNTANVTRMPNMFRICAALTALDLSNFNTANVIDMESMFYGCTSLTSLDLSNFDTANVLNMNYMFRKCTSLTSLGLSNFDTANVMAMPGVFYGCSGLTTIIANNWSASVFSTDMFNGCTSLVGGNGTTYNSSHTNATYAHIDVADNPGYFTAPA